MFVLYSETAEASCKPRLCHTEVVAGQRTGEVDSKPFCQPQG